MPGVAKPSLAKPCKITAGSKRSSWSKSNSPTGPPQIISATSRFVGLHDGKEPKDVRK